MGNSRKFEKVNIRARELRRNLTEAEGRLWSRLRNRQLGGLKFRRQHPIGPFIVDFYCAEYRLVIELDGGFMKCKPSKISPGQCNLKTMASE